MGPRLGLRRLGIAPSGALQVNMMQRIAKKLRSAGTRLGIGPHPVTLVRTCAVGREHHQSRCAKHVLEFSGDIGPMDRGELGNRPPADFRQHSSKWIGTSIAVSIDCRSCHFEH